MDWYINVRSLGEQKYNNCIGLQLDNIIIVTSVL